jgi:DNA-binding transcriptional LysR family regulator
MTMTDRMVDLIKEGIDLAVTTLPIPDSSLVMRRVGSFRLLVCGSPTYFKTRGIPRDPGELANHQCLIYSFSNTGSDWYFETPQGQRAVHVTGNMEVNSTNALKLAAMHGQGLTLLPEFLMVDEIKSGKLIPVLTEFSYPEKPINAVYPDRHYLSANVRSFLDLMTERFRSTDEKIEIGNMKILPSLIPSHGELARQRRSSIQSVNSNTAQHA